ncbi:hypothetical protein Tco_0451341 [Tanacetum coccineum]
MVNFEPDPRVPIILGRPFLRTAKSLIDLYEETLTLRVGKEELVYYADKFEKNKNRHCVHAISVIDFSKDDPFSGSTTTHSNNPSPSSSPVKTSDNFKKFADELAFLDSLPKPRIPLFEFDDNFKSSTINPLFDEMEENVEIKNSKVSDEPVLLNTPLSDKFESSLRISYPRLRIESPTQEEIEIFLVQDDLIPPGVENDDSEDEVNESPNLDHQDDSSIPRPPPEPPDVEKCFEPEAGILIIKEFKGVSKSHDFIRRIDEPTISEALSCPVKFDSEGDVTFLDNLLSDDASHNLASEVISDHEPEQNESSITFSQGVIHFTMSLPGNVHANQSSVIESLPVSHIPVEDSEPTQEEIDIFLVLDDLIPPGVENDDSEDEVNESPNLDHQDDPSIPRPPPEPPDIEKCF